MAEFTELDITQRMIQAGRHAANLTDGTLAGIYLAMRAAEGAGSPCLPPDIAARDGDYYPSDLHGFDLLEWIVGYYGVNIPNGLGGKLYELAGEWRTVAERLEDKTNSLRVEIAAKQGVHNEIRFLEDALRRAVRRLDEGYEIRPESQAHYDMQDALPDPA